MKNSQKRKSWSPLKEWKAQNRLIIQTIRHLKAQTQFKPTQAALDARLSRTPADPYAWVNGLRKHGSKLAKTHAALAFMRQMARDHMYDRTAAAAAARALWDTGTGVLEASKKAAAHNQLLGEPSEHGYEPGKV